MAATMNELCFAHKNRAKKSIRQGLTVNLVSDNILPMPAPVIVATIIPAFNGEGGVGDFVLFRSNGHPELKANP
jgi:hypothetical protein